LPLAGEAAPRLAERLAGGELHRRLVGRKALAAGELVVEPGVVGQAGGAPELFEFHRAAAGRHERGHDHVALLEGQETLARAGPGDPELADVLKDAEALEQGVRLRR